MTPPRTARWKGLDALRGLAVIGMLLVNNPGDPDAVFAPLEHSRWHDCTLADLVFPFFVFVVGVSVTVSLAAASGRDDSPAATRRIWRRTAIIFGLGVLLNWFPFYQSGDIAWTAHPGMLDRLAARLLILRIPGVLQRIALAYLAAALVARRLSSRAIAGLVVALLVGYWLLLTIVPVPGEGLAGAMVLDQPARTIVAHLDRALFDWTRWGLGNHLWESAKTWDPEGALSTLPAIATALLGVLAGRWMPRAGGAQRVSASFAAGLVVALAGWTWSFAFPLNKSLWTSSFVLFTAGIALMLLALLTALLDDASPARLRLARPLIVFGENPLVAYVGSEVARRILHSTIKVRGPSGRLGLDEWTTHALAAVGAAPKVASLFWSLLLVAGVWAALSALSRRGLYLRA